MSFSQLLLCFTHKESFKDIYLKSSPTKHKCLNALDSRLNQLPLAPLKRIPRSPIGWLSSYKVTENTKKHLKTPKKTLFCPKMSIL